jgi:hypothetical protein
LKLHSKNGLSSSSSNPFFISARDLASMASNIRVSFKVMQASFKVTQLCSPVLSFLCALPRIVVSFHISTISHLLEF